jgi:hydrogenase maturation protease
MVGKAYENLDYAPRGVLVVGMGDESRGDGGVGLHLVSCLSQMDWPSNVAFCAADETVPKRAEGFARVILLDALEGPASPGSLYQMDPEELLGRTVGGPDSGMGLLTMLPVPVRKRVAVFGIHPRTLSWGASLSQEVLGSMSVLLTYLRTQILRTATELSQVN